MDCVQLSWSAITGESMVRIEMKKNDEILFPQENAFREQEADAWFERNRDLCETPISADHRVITALGQLDLKERGALVDLGGGAGALAAGVLNYFPDWTALTIELSKAAILAGRSLFPNVEFQLGSITNPEDMPTQKFDLTIVSGVLCWVDRSLLARSIANIDGLVADGGLLLICDFSSPFQWSRRR